MNLKRQVGLGIVLFSLVFVSAGCAAPIPATAPPSAVPEPAPTVPPAPTIASPDGLGPEATVDAFYKWYLSYIGRSGSHVRNPLVDAAYRTTGYVTAAFAERVSAMDTSGGAFDPFLCAQDVPAQVLPSRVGEDTDPAGVERSVVEVRTSFEGQRFLVFLVRSAAGWQIDEIRCGADPEPENTPETAVATVVVAGVQRPALEAAATRQAPGRAVVPQGWQTYHNEEFRFEVGYPAEWVVREVAAAPGEPPIGPENLKLAVMLMPQEWAAQLDSSAAPDPNAPVLAPFTVEVTLGTEDAFWGSYGPQTGKAQVTLADGEALRTVEVVTEQISIPRYIFQHPVSRDLRIVLTDPISGFPDRRTAYAGMAAEFNQVANSFAWLD